TDRHAGFRLLGRDRREDPNHRLCGDLHLPDLPRSAAAHRRGRGLARGHEISPDLADALAAAARWLPDDRTPDPARDRRSGARPWRSGPEPDGIAHMSTLTLSLTSIGGILLLIG